MAKFTSETARIAGQKSKRGKAKLEPILQDAIEVLFTAGIVLNIKNPAIKQGFFNELNESSPQQPFHSLLHLPG